MTFYRRSRSQLDDSIIKRRQTSLKVVDSPLSLSLSLSLLCSDSRSSKRRPSPIDRSNRIETAAIQSKGFLWNFSSGRKMALASDDRQATSICNHCDRAILSSNMDLHFAHCSRNLEKCKVCGDMVPKIFAEEHFLSTHAPVACTLCSEKMERDVLDVHKGENCPQRIVTCEYCEFPLPAIDLFKHQEVCGNRTELCPLCRKYIRLREMNGHESRCNGVVNNIAESSRNTRQPERDHHGGAQRRPQREFSPRLLLYTIAITGIAVLLGSLFFQRKPGDNEVN